MLLSSQGYGRTSLPCFFLAVILVALTGLPALVSASQPAPGDTRVLFILLDGCRADTLERLGQAGKIPTMQRLRSEGLSVQNAVSVFPSTTGPAYAPFITGQYPSNSGLTGIRQYLRKEGTYRSYCGTDLMKIKSDLNPETPTIFELLPRDSLSIVGMIDRGARDSRNPPLAYFLDTFQGNLLDGDRQIFGVLEKAIAKGLPRFTFVTFHAPDGTGHKKGADGPDYEAAVVHFDGLLAGTLRTLERMGELDRTVIILTSDHGQQSTNKKGDLAVLLRKRLGLKVQDAIGRNTIPFNLRKKHNARQNDAIVTVSGNANVQIYLKGRMDDRDTASEPTFTTRPSLYQIRNYGQTRERAAGDVIATLLEDPCVGFLATRDGRSRAHVFSRAGEAEITWNGNLLGYRILRGQDPLALGPTSRMMADGRPYPDRKWLQVTCNDDYPDAVFQLAQLLQAKNSGDILINAAPGYEPWHEGQAGVHGGIDRAQIQVPMILWGKGIPKRVLSCARTVDLFPTILRLLGVKVPAGTPGIPLF